MLDWDLERGNNRLVGAFRFLFSHRRRKNKLNQVSSSVSRGDGEDGEKLLTVDAEAGEFPSWHGWGRRDPLRCLAHQAMATTNWISPFLSPSFLVFSFLSLFFFFF